MKIKEFFEKKKGEAIMISCVKFCFRGIVSEVGEDHVILTQSYNVFETGNLTAINPAREEPILGDNCIMYDAIENVFQPVMAFHGYDKKGE